MKQLVVTIIIGLALIGSVLAVSIPENSYKVNVSLVNQKPDPAQPGEIIEVRFKFENAGSNRADSLQVELVPKYPFSLLPGDTALQNVGSLQSHQTAENGLIVKYKLRVDDNAVEGDTPLTLRYRIGSDAWIQPKDFKISVKTLESILYVTSVDTVPNSIAPGGVGKIVIHFKNLADSFLQNVKTTLDLRGVPLAPIGSSNVNIMDKVDASENAQVEFTVMAEAGAASKVYKVPFELSYNDDLGIKYATNNTVGIVIGGVPDLGVTIDTSKIVSSGTSGKVVLKFVNKGPVDIKFMNIKVDDTDQVSVIGSPEAYIGNIDSDDFETQDFTLYVGNVKDDQVIIPIDMSYKDANYNDYHEKKELSLRVYSSSDAQKYGLLNGSPSYGMIITIAIVVIGIAGYYFYRKRKKK